MKRLIGKVCLVLTPFAFWVLLVLLFDPYNYFNLSHIIPDQIKEHGPSYRLDCRLWKIIKFRRSPCRNIILGDSRGDSIDVNSVKKATGLDFFNFSLYAASIPELTGVFNYAKSQTPIDNVYVVVSFSQYNDFYSDNIFSREEEFSRDFKCYLFDRTVAKALAFNVVSFFNKTYLKIGRPKVDKDGFWKHQLTYAAGAFFGKYEYPSRWYHELKQLSEYCRSHHINLVFLVPPTHTDMQNRVADFGLLQAEQRFLADLRGLGTVYDYNYPNEWTRDRANFMDPLHFTPEIMEKLVDEVWRGNLRVARVSGGPVAAHSQPQN